MSIKKPILIILTILLISCIANTGKTEYNNQDQYSETNSLNISATNGIVDYLIITTENFESILEPLAQWKTQKGVISKIETMSDIDQRYPGFLVTPKIKQCIMEYYNNNNTQWVLLAGDQNHIPTQRIVVEDYFPYDGDVVSCDSYYGDMNGTWLLSDFDYEAEVFVGRLTANNEAEMQSLVQRILNYEKNPPIGDWMTHALLAGAILQYDIDWDGDDLVDYGECDENLLNNYINSTLLPDNWNTTILAQTQGIKGTNYYVDAELDYNHLKGAINQGASIGTIYAHGRPNRMSIAKWNNDYDGDMLFDYTSDPFTTGGTAIDLKTWTTLFETTTADLVEEDKLGMFFFGSCSVGTFAAPADCVAEYFLKNAAIGCVAGSYVVWGEDQWYERTHGGWFVQGLGFRFIEQLFQYNQPGKALALAKADYALDRKISPEPNDYPEWANKTLKQYNLLGDPEVPIWLAIPKQLNVSIDQPFNSNTNTMTLLVTADGDPIQGVTITYTKNNDLLWKGVTNVNGTIEVPFSQIEIENQVFTVSKNGFLPYQIDSPPNGNPGSIPGYSIIGMTFIILGFISITSIYYKRSFSKKKIN